MDASGEVEYDDGSSSMRAFAPACFSSSRVECRVSCIRCLYSEECRWTALCCCFHFTCARSNIQQRLLYKFTSAALECRVRIGCKRPLSSATTKTNKHQHGLTQTCKPHKKKILRKHSLAGLFRTSFVLCTRVRVVDVHFSFLCNEDDCKLLSVYCCWCSCGRCVLLCAVLFFFLCVLYRRTARKKPTLGLDRLQRIRSRSRRVRRLVRMTGRGGAACGGPNIPGGVFAQIAGGKNIPAVTRVAGCFGNECCCCCAFCFRFVVAAGPRLSILSNANAVGVNQWCGIEIFI